MGLNGQYVRIYRMYTTFADDSAHSVSHHSCNTLDRKRMTCKINPTKMININYIINNLIHSNNINLPSLLIVCKYIINNKYLKPNHYNLYLSVEDKY